MINTFSNAMEFLEKNYVLMIIKIIMEEYLLEFLLQLEQCNNMFKAISELDLMRFPNQLI